MQSFTVRQQELEQICRAQLQEINELKAKLNTSAQRCACTTQERFDYRYTESLQHIPVRRPWHKSNSATSHGRQHHTKLNLSKRSATALTTAPARKQKPSTSNAAARSSLDQGPSAVAGSNQPPTKTHKPPPIVVNNMHSKKTAKALTNKIGSEAFSFRRVDNKITHISTKTLADFKTVKTILESSDAKISYIHPEGGAHPQRRTL